MTAIAVPDLGFPAVDWAGALVLLGVAAADSPLELSPARSERPRCGSCAGRA